MAVGLVIRPAEFGPDCVKTSLQFRINLTFETIMPENNEFCGYNPLLVWQQKSLVQALIAAINP
jgi:hypothetical protein